MKRLLFLLIAVLLIAATVGCNTCRGPRRTWFNWWNRGDECRTCGDVIHEETFPGALGAPILNNVPTGSRSTGILPGPVGITPSDGF